MLFGHSELRKPPGGKGTLRRGWIRSKEGRARPRGAAPGYPPGETGVERERQLPKPQPAPTPKPDQDCIAGNDVNGAEMMSTVPEMTSTLPEMMLLPSLMKLMQWQVMLGTVIRSSSRLDSVCHTLMSFLAQVANSSSVPLQRSHGENKEVQPYTTHAVS